MGSSDLWRGYVKAKHEDRREEEIRIKRQDGVVVIGRGKGRVRMGKAPI